MKIKEKLKELEMFFNIFRATGTTSTLIEVAKNKKCTILVLDMTDESNLTRKLAENNYESKSLAIGRNLLENIDRVDSGTILVDSDVLIVIARESLELIEKLENENVKLKEDFEKLKLYSKLKEEFKDLV